MGCTVIPVSGGQTERQVTLIRDLRPEVLCCTPSYAARLGEALAEAGVAGDALALRVGIFGAEPWTEGMRAKIEAALGLRALDIIYGLAVLVAERAVAPHYLLVVDRTETMPKLVVACELASGWSIRADTEAAERERVAGEVGAALLQRLGLATEVRVLPGGTIPRVELGKAKRVVQRTPDHDPLQGLRT